MIGSTGTIRAGAGKKCSAKKAGKETFIPGMVGNNRIIRAGAGKKCSAKKTGKETLTPGMIGSTGTIRAGAGYRAAIPARCRVFLCLSVKIQQGWIFSKSSLLLSFKKEETNRIYPRMTFSSSAESAARYSAPASVNSSRVRNPHSTPQQGSPALWAVATSTLLSPT